jgi:hypothetical protein
MSQFTRRAAILPLLTAVATIGVAGCGVSARSLQTIATQNQTNIAELSRNVAALHGIAAAQVRANALVFVDNRITFLEDELEQVLGVPSEDPPHDTWKKVFESGEMEERLTKDYEASLALVRSEPGTLAIDDMKRRVGWIYTTVADANFTPSEAKRLQRQMSTVSDMSKEDRVKIIPEIMGAHDPILRFRVETVAGVEAVLAELAKATDWQLTVARNQAARFVNASQADAQFDQTISGIVRGEDARELVRGLAQENIEDPAVRAAALALFGELVGDTETP